MKQSNINIFFFASIIIMAILLGGTLVMIIGSDNIENFIFKEGQEQYKVIPTSEQEVINNCKDLNLTKTAYCLRDNIKTFYFYNINNKTYFDIETLKEKGGDCYNYAKLYEYLGKELDFNSTTIRNNGIKNIKPAHRWAVIWDDKTNRKIDQLKVQCRQNEM